MTVYPTNLTQPSQPIAPANQETRAKSAAVLALKAREARRQQRFDQSRKGPAFQSTPSSGTRGSARSSPLVTRRYRASAKSQSGHFRASDSSPLAVTIRPSCTLSVAGKIVQLGSRAPRLYGQHQASLPNAAAFCRPLKPGRYLRLGSCFLPGCIRGRAAKVSLARRRES